MINFTTRNWSVKLAKKILKNLMTRSIATAKKIIVSLSGGFLIQATKLF
jgi:hypothetical protein